MNFYSVVGQCSAWCSFQFKQIGFKNIESIKRNNTDFIINLKDGKKISLIFKTLKDE